MGKFSKIEKELQGSYLISVSDIMVGLLFIFIIILVYFASTALDTKIKANETVEMLRGARAARTHILNAISSYLIDNNIEIIIDQKNGILRLPEGTVSFRHGSVEFTDLQSERNLEKIAEALFCILPCYVNSDIQKDCQEKFHKISDLIIEGHTDTTGDEDLNWTLSTQRALAALNFLIEKEPGLKKMKNEAGKSLFSISGYGEFRTLPRVDGLSNIEYNRSNRRIDFRIIMTPPENLTALKRGNEWVIKENAK